MPNKKKSKGDADKQANAGGGATSSTTTTPKSPKRVEESKNVLNQATGKEPINNTSPRNDHMNRTSPTDAKSDSKRKRSKDLGDVREASPSNKGPTSPNSAANFLVQKQKKELSLWQKLSAKMMEDSEPEETAEAAVSAAADGEAKKKKNKKKKKKKDNEEVMVEKAIEYLDVTKVMEAAFEEMGRGELIKFQDLRLEDLMSAAEIGDHKMDSYLKENESDITNWKEALEAGIIKKRKITDKMDENELIEVMDEFLCQFIQWLNGRPFTQTVCTCVYMICPLEYWPHILKRFVHSFLTCCVNVQEVLSKAPLDDEDFCLGLDPCYSRLHTVLEELDKYLDTVPEESISVQNCSAEFKMRITFLEAYCDLLMLHQSAFNSAKVGGHTPASLEFDQLKKFMAETQVPPVFCTHLNRIHLVPGPPRRYTKWSREECLRKWRVHLDAMNVTMSVFHFDKLKKVESVDVLQALHEEFDDEADVVPRMLAYDLLQQCCKPIGDMVFEQLMKEYHLPADARTHCNNNRETMKTVGLKKMSIQLDDLLNGIAEVLTEWVRFGFKNVARRHRRYCHLIPEFNDLLVRAAGFDEDLKIIYGKNLTGNQAPVQNFLYERKLQVMADVLLFGFSLDLYDIKETTMVHCSIDNLFQHKWLALNQKHEAIINNLKMKSNKKDKNKQAVEIPQDWFTLRFYVRRELSRVITRIMKVLQGHLSAVAKMSGEEELVNFFKWRRRALSQPGKMPKNNPFAAKFDPFSKFQLEEVKKVCFEPPQNNDWLQFLMMAKHELKQCLEYLKTAKDKGLTECTELSQLQRCCVANQLAVMQCEQLLIAKLTPNYKWESEDIKVKVTNKHHPRFISVAVDRTNAKSIYI